MSVLPSSNPASPVPVAAALRSGGLWIDYGACVARVRTPIAALADQLGLLYHAYPLAQQRDFADYHVSVDYGRGLRRHLRPTCRFAIDGVEPFEPFPVDNALPMFEWGVNWCFAQRGNQFVLLHAGVLARAGRAVVMAATPGSGKSTLTAAMMARGFRLLSDEFGVLDPATGELRAMLKPVALKNRSIDVIREFSADAVIGPVFRGTRKGDVAHLAPDLASAATVTQNARPALVIFPRFIDGSGLELKPQPPEQAFSRLAFNSFNYALLGQVSFDAVADVAAGCPAYELRYGRLDEAIRCIADLLADAPGEPDVA
ncbi:MAG: HprK-related kinase A [Rhodocyclaceae bacterium]|nr:HprK-related kinase A [Rhodocyclaceae bacterium]